MSPWRGCSATSNASLLRLADCLRRGPRLKDLGCT